MTPSNLIFEEKRAIRLKAGGEIVVYMNLFEITGANTSGLFLGAYRLSWIAYDPEQSDRRVLMDAHPPVGCHYHIDQGEPVGVDLKTLEDALLFFETKVIQHFGELSERIYEKDVHI